MLSLCYYLFNLPPLMNTRPTGMAPHTREETSNDFAEWMTVTVDFRIAQRIRPDSGEEWSSEMKREGLFFFNVALAKLKVCQQDSIYRHLWGGRATVDVDQTAIGRNAGDDAFSLEGEFN